MADSDDEYTIPLQDQRVFGAGLKRKRVHFVPSSTPTTSTPTPPKPSPSTTTRSIGDLYLSLVLPKSSLETTSDPSHASESDSEICEICNLPIDNADGQEEDDPAADEIMRRRKKRRLHEASLTHQIHLPHSHPPSHIDRTRKGLHYLSSYGWDPDSRLGLGAQGQGITFPIKPKSKKDANDKMGLGLVVPESVLRDKRTKEEWLGKGKKFDAGKVREMEERGRREKIRLQEIFYRSEEVERLLGRG